MITVLISKYRRETSTNSLKHQISINNLTNIYKYYIHGKFRSKAMCKNIDSKSDNCITPTLTLSSYTETAKLVWPKSTFPAAHASQFGNFHAIKLCR